MKRITTSDRARVVVVDDSAAARAAIEAAVAATSEFELVASVPSGEHALAVVPEVDPDLILLDIRMTRSGRARDDSHPSRPGCTGWHRPRLGARPAGAARRCRDLWSGRDPPEGRGLAEPAQPALARPAARARRGRRLGLRGTTRALLGAPALQGGASLLVCRGPIDAIRCTCPSRSPTRGTERIPDFIEPFEAWRVWRVGRWQGRIVLKSLFSGTVWEPTVPLDRVLHRRAEGSVASLASAVDRPRGSGARLPLRDLRRAHSRRGQAVYRLHAVPVPG